MKKKTVASAVICPRCEDIVYSRARHDFRTCTCGDTSVDGGFDYMKICYVTMPQFIDVIAPVSETDLYNDWNYNINKWGLIKTKGK